MTTHNNGWDCGITVYARTVDDADVFDVYRTHGSGHGDRELIATVRSDETEQKRRKNA